MLMNFMNYVLSKVRNEEGQGMVEYALLVGLIAIAAILAVTGLGNGLIAKFTAITGSL